MLELTPEAHTKLVKLRKILHEMGSILVCYSGGLDSALVLKLANEQLGAHAVGMTAVSPSLADIEKQDAARIAVAIGARHYFVETQELLRPGYVQNGPDRCYHCKSELYELAAKKRHEWGLQQVANGTNLDDLGDYRPGLRAAAEHGVRSPLLEADLSKREVRELAQFLGLSIWDKPAAACLSSRIPYGTSVTAERLAQIGGLEAKLKELGFRQVRVRFHDAVARIEIDLQELPQFMAPGVREAVVAAGKAHGFVYVTLDLAGYRTGSHNELLSGRSLKIVPT